MRLMLFIAAGLLTLVATGHCAAAFQDGTGRQIEYGLEARRIVSLAPCATEMLFHLGLGGSVVGRTDYCDYPPEALALASVGGMVDTSLERIVALNPDLVVAYQGNSLELVDQLRQLGLTVVAFREALTLVEIAEQMEELALIAGDGRSVPLAVSDWRVELKAMQTRSAIDGPPVLYGLPGEVVYTAGPGSFIGDLITSAGGVNPVPAGDQRWPQVSAEFVVAAQPDWLLVGTSCTGHESVADASEDIQAELSGSPVWSTLPAVKNKQILVVDAGALMRPGPRILGVLQQLRTALGGGV